jgi:acyl-CoA synthetase (AMP-forming)/AMP-acid ligase II
MTPLLTMGEVLSRNAWLYPEKCGARDLARSMTFREWNRRSCRLANALLGLRLDKGDRIAILAYNCVEWMEIYAATAKAGLIAVPINFRLREEEIRYIVEDCAAGAFIVQDDLMESVARLRGEVAISSGNFIHFGQRATPAGFASYEALIAAADETEPTVLVAAEDTWTLIYTSGTTGKPKGAMRSHGSHALLNFATLLDMGFGRDDRCLLVMPMCHANSLNFASAFVYAGATCCVYDSKAFEPEHLLRTMAETSATFTSLVPTHYVMLLGLPDSAKAKYDVDSVTKLLVSSAPARRDTKLAIMERFRNSQLFEIYGSTEQGWATLLRPEEQLTKLGSVGREFTGSARIKLIAENGDEAAEGEVGELYSRTPWCFEGYWNLPEKTAQAFRGPYLSVGDVARRDTDGYYTLVDRKSNMIISGGENVYPSEVESMLAGHPKVRDVAVIGRPDQKWGEAVHAVVVLRAGASVSATELLDWCANRIAGYKRPKSLSFITDEEMPRTATGKILHRVLKARYERDA